MSGAYDDLTKHVYTRAEVLAILERTITERVHDRDFTQVVSLRGRVDDTEFGQDIATSVQMLRHDDYTYRGQMTAFKRKQARRKIAEQMLDLVDKARP